MSNRSQVIGCIVYDHRDVWLPQYREEGINNLVIEGSDGSAIEAIADALEAGRFVIRDCYIELSSNGVFVQSYPPPNVDVSGPQALSED